MSAAPKSITLDEPSARRLLLVQTIETSDVHGKLISPVERDEIDRIVLQSMKDASVSNGASIEAFLRERTGYVLRVVENRNPALSSLQEFRPWMKSLGVAGFVAAILLGAATDRIANPHRIDLLSLPLLAIVAWNLVVYCILILGYFFQTIPRLRPQPSHDSRPAPATLIRWIDGWRNWHRRSGPLRVNVATVFMRNWYSATAKLQAHRWRKVLHLAAAGWAMGVALSLFARGLVVEYRIGWESTFLDAQQVHDILSVLLIPVTALFAFQSFSVQEIASLRFSDGKGAMAGASWVYLYATLLAVVVIVPRIGLAQYSGWKERMLSRRVVLNLTDTYYLRLLALLNPTRVQLGLMALREEDRQALLRIFQSRTPMHAVVHEANVTMQTLISTSAGEALCIAPIALTSKPQPQAEPVAPARWPERTFERLLGMRNGAVPRTPIDAAQVLWDNSDVMLLLVRDVEDLDRAWQLRPEPDKPCKPALLLVMQPAASDPSREMTAGLCRAKVRSLGQQIEVLSFNRFAASWVQDHIFLEALARCMPDPKKETFARLAEAWLKQNDALFAQSMHLIATQLLGAAREVEEVQSALPFLKRLTSTADREADALARRHAAEAVTERLHAAARKSHLQLMKLHGVDDATGVVLEQLLKENFDFQAPINATEAGLAGVATGAASGASIDLVTGGLTLGAAAALGALIGGGAAFAGAAWKNRATPAGTTLVQLGDEVLGAMTAQALLRYIRIADFHRMPQAPEVAQSTAFEENQLIAAVAAKVGVFSRFWADARARTNPTGIADSLADELQTTLRPLLDEWHRVGQQ